MSIDPKFVELMADVLEIFSKIVKNIIIRVPVPLTVADGMVATSDRSAIFFHFFFIILVHHPRLAYSASHSTRIVVHTCVRVLKKAGVFAATGNDRNGTQMLNVTSAIYGKMPVECTMSPAFVHHIAMFHIGRWYTHTMLPYATDLQTRYGYTILPYSTDLQTWYGHTVLPYSTNTFKYGTGTPQCHIPQKLFKHGTGHTIVTHSKKTFQYGTGATIFHKDFQTRYWLVLRKSLFLLVFETHPYLRDFLPTPPPRPPSP